MILAADINVVVTTPGAPNFITVPPAAPDVTVFPVAGPPGPAGPPGAGGNDWISDQAPVESPDGALLTFTTSVPYVSGTLRVFLNGLRESHVTELTSTTFAFEDAPWGVDAIRLDFLPTP